MALSAVIKNGEIVQSQSQTSLNDKEKVSSASSANKDDFMQLLVAQMKYQDPLEPTSNTEWVSQYATFSELEEMQNMSNSLSLTRASGLVGETVIIESKDASGNVITTQGNVDYVTYEGAKAYLSVGGDLYSIDDLKQVVDRDYLDAFALATEFIKTFEELPSLNDLTYENREMVEGLQAVYNNMTTYQKNFISSDYTSALSSYTDKMKQLVLIHDAEEVDMETTTTDDSDNTEANTQTEES